MTIPANTGNSAGALALLKAFAEYPEAKECLAQFFAGLQRYHEAQAVTQLRTGSHEEALKQAAYAYAFQVSMNHLKHFLENEVRDVEVA